MKNIKHVMAPLFAFLLGASSFYAMADVDVDDFVEEASEKNIAEIEAGKLALEKSQTPSVRAFAQKMINDHTANNTELRSIAASKKVELSDDAALASKAKATLMKQRDGESFDAAYANNQVKAHRDAIEFYKKASKSKDTEVRTFAVAALPKLQHHLQDAETLVSELAKNSETLDNTADRNDE